MGAIRKEGRRSRYLDGTRRKRNKGSEHTNGKRAVYSPDAGDIAELRATLTGTFERRPGDVVLDRNIIAAPVTLAECSTPEGLLYNVAQFRAPSGEYVPLCVDEEFRALYRFDAAALVSS